MRALALGFLLLLAPLPAQAEPIRFVSFAGVYAPACNWSVRIDLAPNNVVAPACGGLLEARAMLTQGDPTMMQMSLAHDGDLIWRYQFWVAGGENIVVSLDALPSGPAMLSAALAIESHTYLFEFDRFDDGPLANTPEPATLLLLGSAFAAAGWRVRRGL